MYFQKLEETESTITSSDVVVVSEATPDGGKAGVTSEVSRTVAAQLITEGRARLASSDEERVFRGVKERARVALEQERLANRVHVTVLSDNEMRSLKGPQRTSRS
jgi:hypothetical protein